jgi:hypothetical protein
MVDPEGCAASKIARRFERCGIRQNLNLRIKHEVSMNTGKSVFKFLGVVLVLSLTVPTVYAQTGRHRPPKIWSPPDKSFSIEVPTDLKEFDGFGEESVRMP